MNEYHLYLYRPKFTDTKVMSLTVDEVNKAVEEEKPLILTMQVCTIGTYLFMRGYRIFIHDKPDSGFDIGKKIGVSSTQGMKLNAAMTQAYNEWKEKYGDGH